MHRIEIKLRFVKRLIEFFVIILVPEQREMAFPLF